MAYDLLHYGRWPYVGTWDQNFPGVILFHLTSILLFGPSDPGFRLLDLLLQIMFSWMLFRLFSRWLTSREAWLAVMLYAFCYVRSAPFVAGERDMFASMITVAVAMPLLREEPAGLRTALVLGLLGGIAVLIRPTFEAYLMLIAVLSPLRNRRGTATVFVLAGLIPLAATFVVYAFWPAALHEYWLATVRFNLDTYAQITRPFGSFLKGLVNPKLLSIPAAIGMYLLIRSRRIISIPRHTVILFWSSIALTIVFVLMQRKYYPYHFAMYLILLTPLAGIGVERLLRPLPARLQMPLFVFVFFVSSLPYEALIRHRADIVEAHSISAWTLNSYGDVYWHDTAESAILQYVRVRTSDTDKVEVCSFDPRMRVHLQREPVGRFASLHPLGFRQNILDPNSTTEYQRRWLADYVNTLNRSRPKYIVLLRSTIAEYLKDPYATILSRNDAFNTLLSSGYRLDTTVGVDEIYGRK